MPVERLDLGSPRQSERIVASSRCRHASVSGEEKSRARWFISSWDSLPAAKLYGADFCGRSEAPVALASPFGFTRRG